VTTVKNNLVAIGSAAVLAVYSAGYVRTEEAADRFAVEDAELRQQRESRIAARVAAPVTADTSHPTADTSAHTAALETVSPVSHDAATSRRSETVKPEQVYAAASTRADSAPPKAAATVTKPAEPAPPANVVSSVASPASPVVTPASPAAPSPSPVAPPVTPVVVADTSAADAPLKDGVYAGWGRSRHGDIEATVAIKNGKITEAFISQCLTQYSCSWVAALPPQVVARQSAEVDYVSGATQSTNAFYYAVIAALKKAK